MITRRTWRATYRSGRAALVLALTVLTVGAMVSCSDSKDEFSYLRIQVDGQPTLAIAKNDILIRGIVMYFHGLNQDEFSMSTGYRDLTKDLVDAGFVVVSSKANGNDYANPRTIHAYQQLASMAMQHYSIANIYFLAESVGAVPAMNLLAANYSALRAMAAIDPVLEMPPPAVTADGAGLQPPMPVQNPMDIAPDALSGQHIRLYLSAGQSSARNHVTAFKDRFGAAAGIDVVDCPDPRMCPPSHDLLDWFVAMETRR